MYPLENLVRVHRAAAARKFAAQFSQREWQYLCSYRWFLAGVGEGLDSGNFSALQAKAEKALVDGKIRKLPLVVTIDAFSPSPWFGFL
jgi:hypothetical protein